MSCKVDVCVYAQVFSQCDRQVVNIPQGKEIFVQQQIKFYNLYCYHSLYCIVSTSDYNDTMLPLLLLLHQKLVSTGITTNTETTTTNNNKTNDDNTNNNNTNDNVASTIITISTTADSATV